MSGALPFLPPQAGLLAAPNPAAVAWDQPPAPYAAPREMAVAGHLRLSTRAAAESAMPELFDPPIAPGLEEYQAGLQPSVAPGGVPWQQEVMFDSIAVTDTDVEQQVLDYFDAAQAYDQNLSLERVNASNAYRGKPYGDEEPGRSQLVMTTVRDTIRSTVPSLLRVFTAVENPCEFAPTVSDNEALGELHAELARQATSYAHWALFTANNGWLILHDAILNCLTRKVGWIKWRWGERRASRVEECDGLLAPQLAALLREPGITAQRVTRRPMLPSEQRAIGATPEGMAYFQAGGAPLIYGARITRIAARGWPIVEALDADQVWVVADADQVETARAIFHTRDLPVSDLISAGLPAGKVLEAAESQINPRGRREAYARDPASGRAYRTRSPGNDPSMRTVRYTEGWCLIDTDGDNVAELVHVHCIGSDPKLIRWDRTDEIPLAAMTPYREPGRIIGLSQADMCMDLQRTNTKVMRGTLDSLGQSLYPRTWITVGQVNQEDARQTAIGAIIRVTQPNTIGELTKPFIGDKALQVLESLEAVREQRTGITRTSQGLTAESLQSTTPTAVSAQTGAAQDRLDMIARTCAETGLAPVYKGLLRLMAKHQDRPNVLSIRGKWIQVDPRALSVQWETQVNIGGKGTPAERLALLNAIATKQEQILAPAVQQGMLDTPIVGLPQYRNTLARMCETAGISDVVSYFKELPPSWQPPPPPPPQPTPDQVLAEVEQQKLEASSVDDARSAQTDRLKIALEDDRSRAEAAVTAWVAAYATAAQHGTPLPSIDEFAAALTSKVNPAAVMATAPVPQQPSPGMAGAPVPPALGVPLATLPTARAGNAAAGMPARPLPQQPARAAPAAAPSPLDAASALAVRRAMLQNAPGNVTGAMLANRALMPRGPGT